MDNRTGPSLCTQTIVYCKGLLCPELKSDTKGPGQLIHRIRAFFKSTQRNIMHKTPQLWLVTLAVDLNWNAGDITSVMVEEDA